MVNHHLSLMTVLMKKIGLYRKKKYKVIKQVYRVKKDGRLNKNSDLTLDKEKPIVEEQLDSSICKIVPNDDPDSNNVVE